MRVITKLLQLGLDLEVEDSIAGFLGVHLEYNLKDGSIKLNQQGLAKQIVEALDVGSCPRKLTPAAPDRLAGLG